MLFSCKNHLLFSPKLRVCAALILAIALTGMSTVIAADKQSARLLDSISLPFDRITLKGGAAIDVMLLDFPGRRLPNPLPQSGELEIRRLSEPSVPYRVSWSSIARVEFFEHLLLKEALQKTKAKDFSEAYTYLTALQQHYPDLVGLREAKEQYLVADATASYSKQSYEEALAILLTLHDLNPDRQGLAKVVGTVSNRLITNHIASEDFASARAVLDMVINSFPGLQVPAVGKWQKQFEQDAGQQLNQARQSIRQGDFEEARKSVLHAVSILPSVSGASEIMQEINRLSPRVMVGVTMQGSSAGKLSEFDWPTSRVCQLVSPQFVQLTDFGAEGGIYDCAWADLTSDDTGLELEVNLSPDALSEGFSPESIALELLAMADPRSENYQVGFGELLDDVSIQSGQSVLVRWQLSHVRPEILMQIPLQDILHGDTLTGVYRTSQEPEQTDRVLYRLLETDRKSKGPKTIVEKSFSNEDVAVSALLRGEIDALDRIPPWQVKKLRQAKQLVVEKYQLPSVHALLPNHSNPLLARREFRRALVYGINRSRILNNLILGGEKQSGFSLLSGPLNKGVGSSDPIGYAYNQTIAPRPYEPRLAAVLSTLARNALAKQEALKAGMKPEELKDPKKLNVPDMKPLRLAHPPDGLAVTVCQAIKKDLDAIGIPIQLQQLSPTSIERSQDYDLLYTELTVWEPLVDAKRILGPGGLAGSCSAAMSLALRNVDSAGNWKEMRKHLHEVHQVANNDLPLIPLWQTVNYFAYRNTLSGIESEPVTLYQNVKEWEVSYTGVRE